jgi:uncharacterized protein with PIN domain
MVNSSARIEFLGGGANAGFFAATVADTPRLVVPSISVFEVCRWMRRELGERRALDAMALMQQANIVDLDATLWTQDEDFEGLDDMKYIAKKKGAK